MKYESAKIKKIGILRALNLGDTLCIIPAVRALKNAFPDADITLIGLDWQKKITERFGNYFTDFIAFPGWPGLPEQEFVPSQVTAFLELVQHRQFDLVIQMQGDGSFTNAMCMLFDAKRVVGLRLEGDYCPDEADFPVLREKENEIRRFMYLVREALHIPAYNSALEFPVSIDEYKRYRQIREKLQLTPGRYICVHPGARDERRRWPPEKFAFVADHLASAGYTILITGDTVEKELTRQVAECMDFTAIDLVGTCGHTGLGELAALIENSAALLSNDTGVSHIAAAIHTPSVIVFSAFSDPDRWAPLNSKLHIPIHHETANDPLNVLKAVYKLLPIKPVSVTDESIRSYSYV
jgi:ADP-heptose:LPS heptosyltransferase